MTQTKIEIINNLPSEKFIRNFEANNRRTEKYQDLKADVVVTEITNVLGGSTN